MNHLQKSQPVHGRAPDLPRRPDAKPVLAAMAQGRVGPGGFPGSSILTKRQDGTQVDKQSLKGIKKKKPSTLVYKNVRNVLEESNRRSDCREKQGKSRRTDSSDPSA